MNLALELVGYEDELRAAMEYVFGSTLVCDSLPLAKAERFYAELHDALLPAWVKNEEVDLSAFVDMLQEAYLHS